MNKLSNVTIAIFGVCFCFVVGAITWLVWGGKDVAPVVTFVTGVLATVIPTIMTLNKVNSVDLKVNGNMQRLIEGLSAAAQAGNPEAVKLANDPSVPIPPVVPSTHDTTSAGNQAQTAGS